ncbi:MAG: helix-turn-helix domain-containing protein [Lachnospiraceae bacterium]|jgi:transcriptional regulator with XRE-family HTH domain
MVDYNFKIMQNNIKKAIDNSGMTQKVLGEKIGMEQSSISKILSENNDGKNCFTVEQLIKLASVFKCSIDDLVGFQPKEKNETTLGDIVQHIFDIDNSIAVEIIEFDSTEYIFDVPFELGERSVGIFIKNPQIIEFLKEWKDMKKINTNSMLRNKLLEIWKQDSIKYMRMRKEKWNFKTELEQGEYLAKLVLKAKKAGDIDVFKVLREDDKQILENYIQKVLTHPQLTTLPKDSVLFLHGEYCK